MLGLLLIVGDRWMLRQDDHLVHARAQPDARDRHARLRERAAAPPLNAAIALSILFLGPEIVRVWRGETSFTIRHPWVVAFAFGLLHGFGFASGLTAMGLPQAEIPLALLLFNVGVEIGQIAFVVLDRAARARPSGRSRSAGRAGSRRCPGYAVGLARRVLDDPARRRCCSEDRDEQRTERAGPSRWPLLALLLPARRPRRPRRTRSTGQAAGFFTGLGIPISGLDHVLAMIAVGLWGAQLGAPAIWLLPVTFPMVMAFGGFLGLVGVPLPGVEVGIALVGDPARRDGCPRGAAAALGSPRCSSAFFAIFHGHAHGTELPAGQSGLMYSIGFVIATGCLHAIGIAIGLIHRWGWGRIALRVAGGRCRHLSGCFFLWRAVA